MLLHRSVDALAIPEARHSWRIGKNTEQAVARLRWRRGLSHISGLIDLAAHPSIDGIELILVDFCFTGQPPNVAVERVILPGPPVDLTGRHVGLVIVLGVPLSAIGH